MSFLSICTTLGCRTCSILAMLLILTSSLRSSKCQMALRYISTCSASAVPTNSISRSSTTMFMPHHGLLLNIQTVRMRPGWRGPRPAAGPMRPAARHDRAAPPACGDAGGGLPGWACARAPPRTSRPAFGALGGTFGGGGLSLGTMAPSVPPPSPIMPTVLASRHPARPAALSRPAEVALCRGSAGRLARQGRPPRAGRPASRQGPPPRPGRLGTPGARPPPACMARALIAPRTLLGQFVSHRGSSWPFRRRPSWRAGRGSGASRPATAHSTA